MQARPREANQSGGIGGGIGVQGMLTDVSVRKARPLDAPYKIADAGGLYLFVSVKGARSWRMKYRHAGKEKLLAFGLSPAVSLTEARARRDEAKRSCTFGMASIRV